MIYKFNAAEQKLLSEDIIPHPLMEMGANVALGKALGVAVKLGITNQLSDTPQRVADIAEACQLSEKGVELVLDCLEALDYVEKCGKTFRFTARGMSILHRDSPTNLLNYILYADWVFNSYNLLEESVKAGRNKSMDFHEFGDYEWKIFTRAMIDLARTNVEEVASTLAIPSEARQMLDLGGGHGLYSIALCKLHPQLRSIVLDLDPVRKYTEQSIRKHQMEEQVSFQDCDILQQTIPGDSDIALLFNVIHSIEGPGNLQLFKKVFRALNPGGQLVVLDQIKGIGGDSQLAKATTSFMAINLFHQANGNTYSFEEVEGWAVEAGFSRAELKKLNAPGFGLIVCRKEGAVAG